MRADGEAVDDYDFALPEDRIALRPAVPRDSAKLLRCGPDGALSDHHVRDLASLLRKGDRLVVNDSRVIPARLIGQRLREGIRAKVELTLTERVEGGGWRALAKPAKKLHPGDRLSFGAGEGAVGATVVSREGAQVDVRFDGDPLGAGVMPLPPYIAAKRPADRQDESDYQTVYAQAEGSIAAPTAGLHFTPALLDGLKESGVGLSQVTLHVGPGTFLPVKVERIAQHVMHAETGAVDGRAVEAIARTKRDGGRIIAVGTTALRLIETAGRSGTLVPFEGETDIFIRPGFQFHVADGLMTNFHLPRSTLLMLVAAFVGLERMRAIYRHALARDYRFFSYGDASLLFRPSS